MGKEWDKDKGGRDKWIAWLAGILRECRRLMKPGSYGWVWALPRTSHWTAMACEDAGYTVRDVMTHVQSQGFPKSRALLKPAAEHWILIKVPGELRELRIDECRIAAQAGDIKPFGSPKKSVGGIGNRTDVDRDQFVAHDAGRWPANFALSHCDDCADTCVEDCPVRLLDEQGEERGSHSAGAARVYETNRETEGATTILSGTSVRKQERKGDSGGVSRFFYQAKPSTKERSLGLPDRNTHPTVKSIALMRHLIRLIAAPGSLILDPFTGSGSTAVAAIE
jgi:site-specific DNA-methyltransferase (adenine-specific)